MFLDILNPFYPHKEGLLLYLKVTPKAAHRRIGSIAAGEKDRLLIKVYVTEVAEKGKANEAVIDLLSASWKITKSRIQIIDGLLDRHKTILIKGNFEEIKKLIACRF